MTLSEIQDKPNYNILLVVNMQKKFSEQIENFEEFTFNIAALTQAENYSCDSVIFVEDPELEGDDFKCCDEFCPDNYKDNEYVLFTGKEDKDQNLNLMRTLTNTVCFKDYIKWLSDKYPDLQVDPKELFEDFISLVNFDVVGNNIDDRCKKVVAKFMDVYSISRFTFLDYFIYPFVDYFQKAKEQQSNESRISSIHTES